MFMNWPFLDGKQGCQWVKGREGRFREETKRKRRNGTKIPWPFELPEVCHPIRNNATKRDHPPGKGHK